jgi:hypothetical protein
MNFSKTTGITGGLTYEFRIFAINVVGESIASPVLAILAAQIPGQPLNVVKFKSDKTSISISW